MSSSSEHRPVGPVRGRVLRGGVRVVEAPSNGPAVLERELGAVSESVRAWNPEQVAAALAAGYADGHAQGLSDGYAEGRAQGLAEAKVVEAERSVRAEVACAALGAAADELRRRQVDAIAAMEENVVDLVVNLTEALLGRELRAASDAPVEALRRGLALAPPESPAVASLHPDDIVALLPVGFAGGIATWEDPATGRTVQLVGDPSVEPGGCIVDAGDARVDARLGPALERIRAALSGLDTDADGA